MSIFIIYRRQQVSEFGKLYLVSVFYRSSRSRIEFVYLFSYFVLCVHLGFLSDLISSYLHSSFSTPVFGYDFEVFVGVLWAKSYSLIIFRILCTIPSP